MTDNKENTKNHLSVKNPIGETGGLAQKTIKCSYCRKIKKIADVYFLKKEVKLCICSNCNLKLDVI